MGGRRPETHVTHVTHVADLPLDVQLLGEGGGEEVV